MGCSNSKIDSEESVARCKDRKRFIKDAVQHRHAFAAAHAAYTQSLKNTGAALKQFGEGEEKDGQEERVTVEPFVTPGEPRFPPPPPPPISSSPPPSPPRPLPSARAVSMPAPIRSGGGSPERNLRMSPPFPVKEEEEEDKEYLSQTQPPPRPPARETRNPPPPPPPPPPQQWGFFVDMFDASSASYSQLHEASTSDYKGRGAADGAFNAKEEKQRHEQQEDRVMEDKAWKKPSDTIEVKTQSANADKKEMQELQLIVQPATKQAGKRSLLDVLTDLDDLFLKAFESGKDVSRMLEARRVHYHSNFADSNSTVNHHEKVLRVMSWTRSASFDSFANGDIIENNQSDEKETHASTLDKLLAWEKKLYDEVKAGEIIRIELAKKSAQLKNQKQRGEDAEKTKAIVKSLHARYLVEFQAVDAASMEVHRLRDEHLYPQLVDLVKGLSEMWKVMLNCHQNQSRMVGDLKSFDASSAPEETTDFHRKNTLQFETEISLWHQSFEKLINTQKDYMKALHGWLRLNIIQIESEVKDKLASPQKMITPPVYHLCRAWMHALDQLPGNVALQALKGFSSVVHEMVLKQAEEIKQKKKYETLCKEYEKKLQSLTHYERKYTEKHMDEQVNAGDEAQASGTVRTPLQERKSIVDAFRTRLEEEKEKHNQLRLQCRSMTLSSLQSGLPPVLQTITTFARVCSELYAALYELTVTGNLPQSLKLGY